MEIVSKVATFYKVGLAFITFKHIRKFCQEELGIVYCGYDFPKSLNMFGGMTIKNSDGILVGYNTTHCVERCNFSMMHETFHALNHMGNSKKILQCSNIFERSTYTLEQIYQEIEADIGSSIFLINDIALIFQILLRHSCSYICKYFGMSKLALKLRIINFLYFNCSLSYTASNLYAERFLEGHSSPLHDHIQKYLKKMG